MMLVFAEKKDVLINELSAFAKDKLIWITPELLTNSTLIQWNMDKKGLCKAEVVIPQLEYAEGQITTILNRINDFSIKLFEDYPVADQEYICREWHSYFLTFLATHASVLNMPHPYLLSGEAPSLLQQFDFARQCGWFVPCCLTTSSSNAALCFAQQNNWNVVLKSSQYDFLKWNLITDEERTQLENLLRTSSFLCQKVEGEAVFVTVVGKQCFASAGYESGSPRRFKLSNEEINRILVIGEKYQLSFYEVKFVYSRKNIFFQYFNSMPLVELFKPWGEEVFSLLLSLAAPLRDNCSANTFSYVSNFFEQTNIKKKLRKSFISQAERPNIKGSKVCLLPKNSHLET